MSNEQTIAEVLGIRRNNWKPLLVSYADVNPDDGYRKKVKLLDDRQGKNMKLEETLNLRINVPQRLQPPFRNPASLSFISGLCEFAGIVADNLERKGYIAVRNFDPKRYDSKPSKDRVVTPTDLINHLIFSGGKGLYQLSVDIVKKQGFFGRTDKIGTLYTRYLPSDRTGQSTAFYLSPKMVIYGRKNAQQLYELERAILRDVKRVMGSNQTIGSFEKELYL
ncbi:MAG: hypothetical protein M1348_02810 [Candidatus Parvarchaeota archaeon]|nr:hypothetical protein [Candidatus Parvarchaeota archaeon]